MNPNHGAMREIYSQYTKILQEQKNHPQEGIIVMIEDDSNATKWTVLFGNFPSDTPLGKDLARLQNERRIDHIKLEIQFPETYPTDPPFVRVISPRFQFHTGHVTIGGSLCIETLVNTGTPTGWQSNMSIWAVLVQVKQLMVDGNARIDFHNLTRGYTVEEARSAFTRVAGQHGWIARKGVANAGLYVPNYPLECNPWWDKYQLHTLEIVELPGIDPNDGGVGSMRHKEAVAIAKIFNDRWVNPSTKPKILAISRVQNMRVFDRFYMKLCELAYFKKDGVNEKWMFHGLKSTESAKAIAEHGFDTRVATQGFLGAGIYCAENSDMAHGYTSPVDHLNQTRHCIYGRFLLGITDQVSPKGFHMETYRRGEKFSMYHEGEKRSITRNYDSESSLMNGRQPFSVMFSNEQAYPDYIISYTV